MPADAENLAESADWLDRLRGRLADVDVDGEGALEVSLYICIQLDRRAGEIGKYYSAATNQPGLEYSLGYTV